MVKTAPKRKKNLIEGGGGDKVDIFKKGGGGEGGGGGGDGRWPDKDRLGGVDLRWKIWTMSCLFQEIGPSPHSSPEKTV